MYNKMTAIKKRRCALYDGCFIDFQKSATLGNVNCEEAPEYIEWVKNGEYYEVAFYTDMLLEKVVEKKGLHSYNIAWLIEPPSLSDTHYQKAAELEEHFDYIFTFDKTRVVADRTSKWMYYPLGGSWISRRDWGMHTKSKLLSIIGTQKKRAAGHKMRNNIIAQYADSLGIDVYGRGYNPISTKTIALEDYMYSIVVESCQLDDYFSEKIVDCVSVGTVPIYWGTNNIGRYFPRDSFIQFNTLDELEHIIVNVISGRDYLSRCSALMKAQTSCQLYRCAEDHIAATLARLRV